MTYDVALCHPDEITKISPLSHPDDLAIPSISSGWLIVDTLCHPDDLPGVGISSGWVTANSLCHPDDILVHFMSSGWLNWGWFLIRMSYGSVIMSSGWDTLPFLSHPDEIANFDFPHHAVALQRFRNRQTPRVRDLHIFSVVAIEISTNTYISIDKLPEWEPPHTFCDGYWNFHEYIHIHRQTPRVRDLHIFSVMAIEISTNIIHIHRQTPRVRDHHI